MTPEPKIALHLFVCTNQKKTGDGCAPRGGGELKTILKRAARDRGWEDQVRINVAGCLGQCERGVAVVLYPEGKWWLDANAASAGEIVNALEERLKKV